MNAICCSENLDFFIVFPRQCQPKHYEKILTSGGPLFGEQVKPHKRFDPNQTAVLEKHYVEAGNANGALVIPVGLAFAESYKRKPDMNLHKAFDGSHPNLLGTYLAASVVYATLYQSPVGNGYDYFGKISKEDAAYLQQVAQDTVANFFGR
ncbi:MAG: hypothetical protein KJO42_02670 [Silicimonas sp.]|nr:hypothetical protein [Silicimonas sp.]